MHATISDYLDGSFANPGLTNRDAEGKSPAVELVASA
jgi:hypothetical protein